MVSIYEIIANKYFAWCDKMSRTKFSGDAVCPADGRTYWFVLGKGNVPRTTNGGLL